MGGAERIGGHGQLARGGGVGTVMVRKGRRGGGREGLLAGGGPGAGQFHLSQNAFPCLLLKVLVVQ